MNKHLIAFSLIGALSLTAKATAETNTEQTTTCYSCSCQPCCCEPKPPKCIDCECYTPQFYDLQCDCGFFLNGEFLYWYARESNLSYAAKIQSEGFPLKFQSDVEETIIFSPQTYEYLSTKWDPGFRVGVGYNSACDGWDYFLHWTYFSNKKSNSTSVSPDYSLDFEFSEESFSDPFLADNQEFFLLNPWINASFHGLAFGDFSTIFPGAVNQGSIVTFDKIKTKWQLNYHSIDLEIGRKYWLSKCFNLRPYAGLRGARTKTTFGTKSFRNNTVDFSGNITDLALNFNDRFKTQNWGAGFLGGLQPTWYFCRNFALYSNLDVALLWGEYENKKQENYQITLLLPDGQQIITPIPRMQSKGKFFQMNAILDLAIGLRWEEYWCCDQYRSTFDVGWEHHIWFDHDHRIKTSDFMQGQVITDFPTKIAKGFRTYDEVTSNLSYGGLVVRLRFDF